VGNYLRDDVDPQVAWAARFIVPKYAYGCPEILFFRDQFLALSRSVDLLSNRLGRVITFNAWLEEQCRKRQNDRLRGESETIGERLQRDLAAMQSLPGSPFEACDQVSGQVSSRSLVRYRTNDYSVPARFGHQDVWIRGYVDEVVIGCRGEIIARHRRSYEREDVIFDPLHYLVLIEQKINALDQAGPCRAGNCPRRSRRCAA
jgi:hypothetical protein